MFEEKSNVIASRMTSYGRTRRNLDTRYLHGDCVTKGRNNPTEVKREKQRTIDEPLGVVTVMKPVVAPEGTFAVR
jgi:hypothetical protein